MFQFNIYCRYKRIFAMWWSFESLKKPRFLDGLMPVSNFVPKTSETDPIRFWLRLCPQMLRRAQETGGKTFAT